VNDYETIDAELANPRWLDAETLADQLDGEVPAGVPAIALGNSDGDRRHARAAPGGLRRDRAPAGRRP
jgi:hypothetical protein